MKDPDVDIENLPIVFLDMDGVLNDGDFFEPAKSTSVNPECVQRLNQILEATDSRIVLSSAWRYMIIGKAMSLIGFDYMLRTHGVIANRLVGRTCADEEVQDRGWQIHEWRKVHNHNGRYVVIDDRDDRISKLHPFVQTNGDVGLQDHDVVKAIEILNRK